MLGWSEYNTIKCCKNQRWIIIKMEIIRDLSTAVKEIGVNYSFVEIKSWTLCRSVLLLWVMKNIHAIEEKIYFPAMHVHSSEYRAINANEWRLIIVVNWGYKILKLQLFVGAILIDLQSSTVSAKPVIKSRFMKWFFIDQLIVIHLISLCQYARQCAPKLKLYSITIFAFTCDTKS